MTETDSPYNTDLSGFEARYRAQCHCGAIQYAAACDPLDAKLCHCTDCQTLHGAPMQWAAIFHKTDIRFLKGVDQLSHYNSNVKARAHSLPRKVSCVQCGTFIADEGRHMWFAFPTLFNFGKSVPAAFKPTCHIFYDSRVIDCHDQLPKWSGHKEKSPRSDND